MTVVVVAIAIYIGLSVFHRHRTAVAALGAGVIVLLGQHEGFYPASAALEKIPLELLILILVLGLFTKEFEDRGLFAFLSAKAANLGRGRRHRVMAILVFSTYVFSLFANNLSVTLVFTTICFRLGVALRMPIAPILIATVVSANIGGCPLPWADTPAIVLTIYTDFRIMDFLTYLFPLCSVFALMLVGYTYVKTKTESRSLLRSEELVNLESLRFIHRFERFRWNDALVPGTLFVLLLAGLSLAPVLGVSVWIAAVPPAALLVLSKGKEAGNLLDIEGLTDTVAFISALFVVAGALEASGVLNTFAARFADLVAVSTILPIMSVLLLAFVASTFLSAGPAAATLLPICLELSVLTGKIVYAAMALGILAGSGVLPWSATGGPVMLNQVARCLKQEDLDDDERGSVERLFRLGTYTRFSMPFSAAMLVLSAFWLYFLTSVGGYM